MSDVFAAWKQYMDARIAKIKGGSWWSEDEDDPCRGYGDASADTYNVTPGAWNGAGPVLARFEPFIFCGSVRYAREGGGVIGGEGCTPSFIVTPFETDGRDNRNKSLPARFELDGGLWGIPFPAQVQLAWKNIPEDARGRLSYSMTTYGPARRGGPKAGGPAPSWERWPPLAPLGSDRWHVTRWLEHNRQITVPEHATRFRVSDSNYGVKVGLHGGLVAIPAPFADPVSLGGSSVLLLQVLAPLAGVAPTNVPVEFYY